MTAEHEPACHERARQQQQGAAGRISVPSEGVLEPSPSAKQWAMLPPMGALLG